jgi:hypothetical protein
LRRTLSIGMSGDDQYGIRQTVLQSGRKLIQNAISISLNLL